MINSGFNTYDKLRIQPCSDKLFSNPVGGPQGYFEATINPESYTTRHKIEFCDTQAPGTSMPTLKFNKIAAQEINFDFLFDSTGVIKKPKALNVGFANPLEKQESVADKINEFREKIINYQGEVHRPYFLKIYWGTLLFKCVLTNLDIEFKLFSPDGTPLRAIAKCTFKGTVDEELRMYSERNESPDITHEKVLKSGDRLSLLTHKIYDEQNYLPCVAAFNRLDSFRNIKAGTKLYFPPIEK